MKYLAGEQLQRCHEEILAIKDPTHRKLKDIDVWTPGAGEMPQQFTGLAAVAEDPSSVPRIHVGVHNCT